MNKKNPVINPSFFDTKIEFLKGVGPQRAALLQKELNIFTYGDLLQHFPFRHEDRTQFYTVKEVDEHMAFVQLKGKITNMGIIGGGYKKRLVATFADETGKLELVWFQGINWVIEKIKPGVDYVVFGKPSRFGRKLNIAHPEIDAITERTEKAGYLQPVYPLTEKLKAKRIDNKVISKLEQELLRIGHTHISETLPDQLISLLKFPDKRRSIIHIHFPTSHEELEAARQRLKFEELFYLQLRQ